MNKSPLAVVILAAGQGTRMKSTLPKVMHKIAGTPMLAHVLGVARELEPARIVVVTAPGADAVVALVKEWNAETVVQDRPLGTGHAVLSAAAALKGFDGDLLVLFGDAPLLSAATLERLMARMKSGADIAALGFRAADPTGYGRMICEEERVSRIVEEKDATPAEARIDLCFAGMLAGHARAVFALLSRVGNRNAQGEFYLTELIGLAHAGGLVCTVVEGREGEMLGVNSRAQLAEAEAAFQTRRTGELMEAGVSFVAPYTVHLSADTEIEPDAVIGPYVVFGTNVRVKRGAEIKAFSHLEGAEVGEHAIVGPFARLRPGAVLEENVHVGNFVEVKNSRLKRGAKANHLAYLGDASVGATANIGAGTITCNYDGDAKHHTEIGAGTFIGSNSTLVAPVTIGDGAYVAAGSTITQDVEAEALAIGRSRQSVKPRGAERLRSMRKAKKKDA